MWLINTSSLQLEYFHDALSYHYAILSHTWENEEVTFQDLRDKDESYLEGKQGFKKVVACCKQAREDGFRYAWIDTCCIDKTSSAELSEAINSMYAWYQRSAICYAYLSDIPCANSVRDPNWGDLFDVKRRFKLSRWFTRGWTLQELLAPPVVEFYAANWEPFGSRAQLRDEIGTITGINSRALAGEPFFQFNVAEKMSWAAERRTTRVEDKAYCLFGIFEVNLPLLYGEGERAFLRLQEHILQIVEDYTIFAWPGQGYDENPAAVVPCEDVLPDGNSDRSRLQRADDNAFSSMFARDPDEFKQLYGMNWNYSDLHRIPDHQLKAALMSADNRGRKYGDFEHGTNPPAVSARGIHLCLPLLHLFDCKFLACLYFECVTLGQWLCITLIQNSFTPDRFARDTKSKRDIHFIPYPTKPIFTRCQVYGLRLRPEPPGRTVPEPHGIADSQQATMNIKTLVLLAKLAKLAKLAQAVEDRDDADEFYRKSVALATRLFGENAGDAVKVLISSDEITIGRIRLLDESYSPQDWLNHLARGADDPRHWQTLLENGRILQSSEQIRQKAAADARDLAYREQRAHSVSPALSPEPAGVYPPGRYFPETNYFPPPPTGEHYAAYNPANYPPLGAMDGEPIYPDLVASTYRRCSSDFDDPADYRSRRRGSSESLEGKSRSRSQIRPGLPIAAAGLAGAAVTALYERRQAKKEEKEERSRSKLRSRPVSSGRRHSTSSDTALVEYGGEPIYPDPVASTYRRRSSDFNDPADYRSRRRGSSESSEGGHRHRSRSSRSRSKSRSRRIAETAAVAGVAGIAAHEAAKRRERKKAEKERQRNADEANFSNNSFSPPPNVPVGPEPAAAYPPRRYFPETNYFPPPPTREHYPAYNPAEYPLPSIIPPQNQEPYGYTPPV